MRIGEMVRRTGVGERLLRYYEEQGLLEPERSPSGQRLFPLGDVERVRFFQDMYAAGLTSADVAQLLPCIETGHTDAEQRRMLRAERTRISEKLEQLRAALARLDRIIAITDTHP